jgi:Ca2+:H+ antiporter
MLTLPFYRLAVITAFVAVCAEFLVGAIDSVCKSWGVSQTFVGLVLLPIVGNAAEHVTAVTVAIKNKVRLGMSNSKPILSCKLILHLNRWI